MGHVIVIVITSMSYVVHYTSNYFIGKYIFNIYLKLKGLQKVSKKDHNICHNGKKNILKFTVKVC